MVQRSLTAKSQGNDLIGPRSQTKSKPMTHFIACYALLVILRKFEDFALKKDVVNMVSVAHRCITSAYSDRLVKTMGSILEVNKV